jgi:hypothetical protein
MNSTEHPRVYAASSWSKPFETESNEELFLTEEKSLLGDINDVIQKQLHNKIAALSQHAIKVRTHTLVVDRYLHVWTKNKKSDKALTELIERPEKFHIFKYVSHQANISKLDMPTGEQYKEFFNEHPLSSFRSAESLCSMFAGCPLESLENALRIELPTLLASLNQQDADPEVNEGSVDDSEE